MNHCPTPSGWLLFLCLWAIAPLEAAEKVVLQLKWEHEFQFAGYYAALWQGYYQDAGLDVEIRPASRPDRTLVNPQEELIAGRADFAIGAIDILTGIDKGQPLVVLAPIFQKSPGAIFSLASTELKSPARLAQLTIAARPDDFVTTEVKALLHAEGVDPASVNFVDLPLTMETLLSGKADAIVTYAISASTAAAEAGISLNVMHPSDYGIVFYGDTLYTHQRVIDRNPELVQRFRAASLEGWQYALENKREIADRISTELPRYIFSYDDPRQYNRAFAAIIDDLLLFPITSLGNNNPYRWEKMHQLLEDIGIVHNSLKTESLFFDLDRYTKQSYFRFLVGTAIAVVLFTLLLLIKGGHYPAIAAVFAVVTGGYLAEHYHREQFMLELKAQTLNQLHTIHARLTAVLTDKLALIQGFALHIADKPHITQEEFSRYAKKLLQDEPLLINFAAAPDMVVTYVFPEEQNQAVLGLDYRTHPQQRDAAMRVRKTNRITLAGPVKLVQGGVAFISRAPVRTADADWNDRQGFWGIVSSPIDADGVYQRAGLYAPGLTIDIAIRGKDALGEDGSVFFGDGRLFNRDPVMLHIPLADGGWQIAGVPKDGWQQTPPSLWLIRIVTLLLATLIGLIMFMRARQFREKARVVEALHRNENLLQQAGKMANIGAWEFDVKTGELYWSEETFRIYGLPNADGAPDFPDTLAFHPTQSARALKEAFDQAIDRALPFDQELELLTRQGRRRWVRSMGEPVVQRGSVVRIMGSIQDCTEQKNAAETIRYQAHYDALTGLPNRALFDDRLTLTISAAQRNKRSFALFFMDLDNFKSINDSEGHHIGDELLCEVAKRLKHCVRKCDTVARQSGDEFIMIIQEIGQAMHAMQVADRMITDLSKPYHCEDKTIYTSASIGIAVYPDDTTGKETLIKYADQAMYAAKASGRNAIKFFTQDMQRNSDKRHQLLNELNEAIVQEQFDVYYQPIVTLSSGIVGKCEALVRWNHPTLGIVPPMDFIPVAEEMGLIGRIGDLVMAKASSEIAELNASLATPLTVSVNKSTRDFLSAEKSATYWVDKLKKLPLFPHIIIEITESLLMEQNLPVLDQLKQLRSAGIQIAIDDFGTGYSSLSYLKHFPVDFVKIDRSFIVDIEKNSESRCLVEAIIAMAQSLRINVVAEGVENGTQAAILLDLGCAYAQGYHYSKPLPITDFKRLINRSAP